MRSRTFWIGVIAGVVVSVLIGLFVVPVLGLFEMTATGGPGLLDWWGDTNWESSLVWRAPDEAIPASANPDEGMEHYASTCLECHGAPNAEGAEWAQRMQPMPPELWEEDTQEMSDGKLFHIIKGGVRMTGMPAFGPDHGDADIWNMVAFVRKLNDLSDEQKQKLSQASQRYEHEHYREGHEEEKPE